MDFLGGSGTKRESHGSEWYKILYCFLVAGQDLAGAGLKNPVENTVCVRECVCLCEIV